MLVIHSGNNSTLTATKTAFGSQEMAFLSNISLSSKIPSKLPLSFTKPLHSHCLSSLSRYPVPQGLKEKHEAACQNLVFSLGEMLSKASLFALLSASLFIADPALAFRSGGPYDQEVTRGQHLTGKDFSGKTLINQDFRTSILRQAKFKGAKLLGASFFDADLTDTDLRGADFSLANVTKVNLSNANLEGALATGNTSFKKKIGLYNRRLYRCAFER